MKDSFTILIAVIATLSCWRMIKTYIPIPKFSELLLQLHWLFPFTMIGGLIVIMFDSDRTVPVASFACGMVIGLACYNLTNVLWSIYGLLASASEPHGKVIVNTFEETTRKESQTKSDARFYNGRDKLNVEYYTKFPKVRVDNMPKLTHRCDGSFIPEETIFSDWDQEYADHVATIHSLRK